MPQASDIPFYVYWPIKTDQTLSSTTTSDWAVIMGPDGTFPWTGDDNVQFADDDTGTNATVAATSGNHTHDNLARKYVRIDAVNSGAGRTAVSSNFTLNGVASPFYSISATLTTYPTVDNGGTEYSRWATNGAVSGIAKGIFASRRWNDSNINDMCSFGGVSTSVFRQNMNTSGDQARLQMLASNIHWARFNIGNHPTGQWLDEIHMFDWTKDPAVDGKTAVAKMVRNYVPQLLDESNSAFNTLAGTRTCTLDNLLGTTASKGLGFFATSGGAGVSDSRGEWMWAWFGQAADAMPDIADPFVASKFGADHFGADGSAGGALPTPHIFFHADADGPGEWNAGLANRGSLGGTVSKISGGAYA